MDQWKDKFRRFMAERYGNDELNRFLMTVVLVFIVINLFARKQIFFWLEFVLLVLCYARMFSKNANARFRENQNFLHYRFYLTEGLRTCRSRLQEWKKYKLFKCPNCGQKLRIPRGHGRIRIHCRTCGHDFTGKS